jgi:hypothetical protein
VSTAAEPLLRTLAPALRRLDDRLRGWMAAPRPVPFSTLTAAALEGLSADLKRQAADLDVDRPLLVIVLMGGTGVGKSTLLNALARGAVAQASYTRPTTREPVVYYHESVRPDRLHPALQGCRLVAHGRPGLEQKVIVDTPDLDSNEPANRAKLLHILPVADVVLYVGSQEKYHDRLGWDLFREQRQRRAFAFVLNKWDRCLHGWTHGSVRPDDDLLRDLKEEGFDNPLLFRTCAQSWVEANGRPPAVPEGEQFPELERWLELGLTRLEIEAIKARGVGQLLHQLEKTLEAVKPPDLTAEARRAEKVWERSLRDEAREVADILLATLDPHQRDIERHFALEGHRRFRGLMAGFLHLVTRLRYLGTTIKRQAPRPLRLDLAQAADAGWDLAGFSKACTALASDRHLDARGRALPNRLVVLAEEEGFPLSVLNATVEGVAHTDWRQKYSGLLLEVLHEVESQWVQPSGPRRWLQTALIWLGDVLPLAALAGGSALLLYDYFWSENHRIFSWSDLLLPLAAVFFTLVIMYVVIVFMLPIRWPAIRGTFHRRLTERLTDELARAYLPIPHDLAARLNAERRQVDQFLADLREVAAWLQSREAAANVGALYGSTG